MIALAHANSDVHALVRSGAVKASTAIDALSIHGEGAGAFLQGEFEKAKASGESRVTPSTIHGRALPRKVVSPQISGVDAFMQGMDANQRATLMDIQEGRVASDTITIPAALLMALFEAHGAVETVRAKRALKAAREAQKAAPDTQSPIDHQQDGVNA